MYLAVGETRVDWLVNIDHVIIDVPAIFRELQTQILSDMVGSVLIEECQLRATARATCTSRFMTACHLVADTIYKEPFE